MQLPAEFISSTEALMGPQRFGRYIKSFEEEAPVSLRLNPQKVAADEWTVEGSEPVPWCAQGRYLSRRPNFTMDPLLHAGCYYVQEAASMFLEEALRQTFLNSYNGEKPNHTSEQRPVKALDLCAAPGGKSTLLRALLPADSVLYSNEPVRQRASILLENVMKWGYDHHHTTCLMPRDYSRSGMMFDLILCDVPCSGEGMFRKDPATIGQWSPGAVEKCSRLQREIVSEAWHCLHEGGLLIYSTCTFNTKENEENILWMQQQLGATVLPVETRPEWGITGSLLKGFTEPVYRFIPGITRSEGLFMCVLQKEPSGNAACKCSKRAQEVRCLEPLPLHAPAGAPRIDLNYPQAMAYLRREAITLPPDAPHGIVEVCFMGHPLGMAKNIGTRANNLYPKEWKIKTTHLPNDYEAILRHT